MTPADQPPPRRKRAPAQPAPQAPPGRAMETLLVVLGAWTLGVPAAIAALMYLLFANQSSSSGAMTAYLTLGWGGALLALGGVAVLALITLISAFVVREQRPKLFFTGLAAAPAAVALELAITWWLLDVGNLLL